VPGDELHRLQPGDRQHVMVAKSLREFVLVLEKMLACGLTFLLEN
jgi:hypothetical protein